MNHPTSDHPAPGLEVEQVVEAITQGGTHARFVTEIARDLARDGVTAPKPALEAALSRLEAEGRLLVREFYCADPHLEGIDLRIAGAVLAAEGNGDPISLCVDEIEAAWQEWITAYLAEHRCS
jgi:hypothetical protein